MQNVLSTPAACGLRYTQGPQPEVQHSIVAELGLVKLVWQPIVARSTA